MHVERLVSFLMHRMIRNTGTTWPLVERNKYYILDLGYPIDRGSITVLDVHVLSVLSQRPNSFVSSVECILFVNYCFENNHKSKEKVYV